MRLAFLFIVIYFIGPVVLWLTGVVDLKANYLTANRESAGLAPLPTAHPGAIIQVYAARAFNWRGLFAVHTWIAVKAMNATHYTVYQVIGWRALQGLSPVVMSMDIPDRHWFNAPPAVILDIRGQRAEAIIHKIQVAANNYPYPTQYVAWPGPNSNTFTAFIARSVPELRLLLPSNAVGKDYLGKGVHFDRAPSNTGWQVSLNGLLGIMLAKREGLELNLLGLTIGLNPLDLSISLPGFGRISPLPHPLI